MPPTLQLDDDSSSNNDAATIISMDPIIGELWSSSVDEQPSSSAASMRRLLFLSGFLTLVMDLATALYKPPQGVVFERHRLAYYLTLAGIFLAGLAEVATAFWLSWYGQAHGVITTRAILYASFVPLVIVTALGGSSILIKP